MKLCLEFECEFAGKKEKLNILYKHIKGSWLSCSINLSFGASNFEFITYMLVEHIHGFESQLKRIILGANEFAALYSYDCQSGIIIIPCENNNDLLFVDVHLNNPAPFCDDNIGARLVDGNEEQYRFSIGNKPIPYPFGLREAPIKDDDLLGNLNPDKIKMLTSQGEAQMLPIGLQSSICGLQIHKTTLNEIVSNLENIRMITNLENDGL